MLLDNSYTYDYRVMMEAQTLALHYDVTLFAIKDVSLPEEEIKNGVRVKRIFSRDIKRFNNHKLMSDYADIIARQGFEIIHCHDYLMLEIGRRIKQLNPDITLIYDAHELFHSWPLNFKGKLLPTLKTFVAKKVSIYREKKNARLIDYLITVNQSLANNLSAYFKLDKMPLVLRNLQNSLPYTKGQHILRKHFQIPDSKKILVFIGAHVYFKSLNIKMILDQFATAQDVALVFIAKADANRKEVEDYAKSIQAPNVYFHDIVPPEEIPQYLCDCYAGLVPTWNKKDLSYWYALDNKLFNYLLAGIPILATAQPEYKLIVNQYKIGVCVNPDEPNAYINGFNAIKADYDNILNHIPAAQKELNWEKESEKLITFYQTIFS
jgi:glycosyltransferase involved in cell wall biosynthesis